MTARIRRRFDPLFWPRFALGLLRFRATDKSAADYAARSPLKPKKSSPRTSDSLSERMATISEHLRLRRQIERGEDASE